MSDTIRPMTLSDVNAVVEIHLAAYPGFFLTFLGRGFLRQLYRGIVEDDSGMAFVAERDGECCGFSAGTAAPARFYSRLIRRRLLAFAFHGGFAVLRRPNIVPRLVRALAKPSGSPPVSSGRAEFMSLGVLPSHRKGSLGQRLAQRFFEEARDRGAKVVYLTTDAVDNDAVNRFHVRSGFSLVGNYTTPEGRIMNVYEMSLV